MLVKKNLLIYNFMYVGESFSQLLFVYSRDFMLVKRVTRKVNTPKTESIWPLTVNDPRILI